MTQQRPLWINAIVLMLAGVVFISLLTLGNWQLQRLAWKKNLIVSVETRAFAEPIAATEVSALEYIPEYTRLKLRGVFLHHLSLHIKAVTELGPGFWLMTPFESANNTLWVNRGFIPTGIDAVLIAKPTTAQELVGLARPSKPKGTLLEKNNPVTGRWYSADIPAMSTNAGISTANGFYLDAEANQHVNTWPRGGMTRLTFKNTHLSYAITWFAMAALLVAAIGYLMWHSGRESAEHR